MTHRLLLCVAACTPLLGSAQDSPQKAVHIVEVREKGRTIHRAQEDARGNLTYVLHDGDMGEVTFVAASSYDSTGRCVSQLNAHSNIGCYAARYAYPPGLCETWSYPDLPDDAGLRGDAGRRALRELHDADDLLHMPEMQALLKGTPYLSSIAQLDTAGRTLYEAHLNEQGDTSSTFTTAYAPNGQERYYRYHDADEPAWRWEYFGTFNAFGDRTRWSRVKDGDTTEQHLSHYDADHREVEGSEMRDGRLFSTTTYQYDSHGNLVQEVYSEPQRPDMLFKTIFRYGRHGRLRRRIHTTFYRGKVHEVKKWKYTTVTTGER